MAEIEKPSTNERGADAGRIVDREPAPPSSSHQDGRKDTAKGNNPGGSAP